MSDLDRQANLLGALALIVTDSTSDAVAAAAGQSLTAATALSALHHFLGRPSVDRLGRVLGLTHSGAVRLVDRLTEAGYVTRGPGEDGRSRSVTLTRKGQRAAARVSARRAELLSTALAELPTAERAAMHGSLSRLMEAFIRAKLRERDAIGRQRGPGSAAAIGWTCRLCDTTACGRDEGQCPAANAAATLTAATLTAVRKGPLLSENR